MHKQVFGYVRVSTAKQGEKGVSLQEQRDAILRCVQQNSLELTEWFEERETAAKRGRPVFNRMLQSLRKGKATGVIIHKIDRGARNLKDWADLGEMIDRGIDVYFANENLDLHSRGGRLSADIQAVVAADYIRNLREETRKGFYGRLKQGILPLPAPIGYRDEGRGKPKSIDPVQGPLVRRVFERYGTGTCNLKRLQKESHEWGLRNRNGKALTLSSLSYLLNNPFYIGLIRIKRTGETFEGKHPPLVPKSLFDRAQRVLRGKTVSRSGVHQHLFRRMVRCGGCGYSLIGERQKGRVYYRCQTKSCPTTTVREDVIDRTVRGVLSPLQFNEREMAYLRERVTEMRKDWDRHREEMTQALKLKRDQISDRLTRLTDGYLDQVIDREVYQERKTALLLERREVEESMGRMKDDAEALPDRLEKFLELVKSVYSTYESGLPDEKRETLQIVTSNRTAQGKNVVIELSFPFSEIANRHENANGAPYRNRPRTLDALLEMLIKWVSDQTSK